jgi:hypothetical protein
LRATRVIGLALTGNGDTAAGRATATIDLPADATPQQIANAAAALVRQGKWRT